MPRISWSVLNCIFYFCIAIPLSDDHKPNRSDERKRIEDAGGVVMWAGKSPFVLQSSGIVRLRLKRCYSKNEAMWEE